MINLLSSCNLCPHKCGVDRLNGEKGFCGAGNKIRIYSYNLHQGEEPPISAVRGSGTIFFSYCNSRCVYCQNYKFSQLNEGKDIEINQLAEIMLSLQNQGAHNINLVSPTHFVPQIICAFNMAKEKGLAIPLIYNTNGYELPETIELLKGIIDVYLPDMKYADDDMAFKYSKIKNYVFYNRAAVKAMYKQVGDLIIENNTVKKGLIIRHLVLPLKISGTRETMRFIRDEISQNTFISLMSQYYPVFLVNNTSSSGAIPGPYYELNRQITEKEYNEAVAILEDMGLFNGWCQDKPNQKDLNSFLGVNFDPVKQEKHP